MSHRIEYIDALRGFTMLLVVLGHIPMYCYHEVDGFFFSSIPSTFHLALFFFISGWFCGNRTGFGEMAKGKLMQLIVPTTAFYLLFCWLFNIDIIDNLWNDKYKAGYWFCVVLFCFFLIDKTLKRFPTLGGGIIWAVALLCGYHAEHECHDTMVE